MSKQSRKKLGYKEYEGLLAQAHQKLEFLAQKFHELQTYFIGYVEYREDNVKFNEWMNVKIKEMKVKADEKKESSKSLNESEKVHEKV